jgi:hypothetical protein
MHVFSLLVVLRYDLVTPKILLASIMRVTCPGLVGSTCPWYSIDRMETYDGLLGPTFEEHVDADITKRPLKGSVMVVNDNNWNGFMSKV